MLPEHVLESFFDEVPTLAAMVWRSYSWKSCMTGAPVSTFTRRRLPAVCAS